MVEISDQLRALVTTHLTKHNGAIQIELPAEIVENGAVDSGKVYQIAVIETVSERSPGVQESTGLSSKTQWSGPTHDRQNPPVEEGDIWTVTIESIGDQGDGIARVERGFVVIVSDTNPDEEVTIEIETVKSNVAFARVLKRNEQACEGVDQ